MWNFLITLLLILHSTYSDISTNSNRDDCPNQCNCELAPLRSAPFVMTWMTSFGEEDLIPNLHPNDILNADLMVNSRTANDARVDVESVGLHVTCSLHPTTNVTRLLDNIPKNSMVLNILQSPGCNMTFIDGGQLVGLSSLRALHLQGYAHKHSEQVSGFRPNSVSEMIEHMKLIEKEIGAKEVSNLRLALAEDALQPLSQLQLLDLQFVRLVSSKDARRPRRYSTEPISSMTLLDMPLPEFVKFVDGANVFDLPSHLRYLLKDAIYEQGNEDIDDSEELVGDSYMIERNMFTEGREPTDKSIIMKEKINSLNDKDKYNIINALKDDESVIVPYEVYRDELQPQLAPFQTLKELKYLRVAHARLDRVGPELLEGSHQLHTLTLEYNKIKVLPEGMFSPTPALRHLSIAHNNIFTLESESLGDLPRLLTLDMDYNKISMLGPTSFPHLSHLRTLRFVGNPVTHLLSDTFASLNSTENIFLGSSDVSTDIHENTFRFLNSIQTLVLKNITKESIEKKIFNGMPTLRHLTIHGIIPEITYDAFSSISLLRTLNLSYCFLNKLSMDSFYGLNSLDTLDLSHNAIVKLSPGTFDYLTSLRELYLHNNFMTTLPLGLFLPMPVKLIQLNNNPWFCTCDLLQLSPSITNKVKREGIVKCEWNEKLTTVCKKQKDKFIYDARVAPLCYDPVEIRGTDVYHAALRHLKCSKFHWDPRLLKKNKNKNKDIDEFLLEKNDIKETTKVNIDKDLSWLPLDGFTPEPNYSKDLLEIAEGEGLEEVIEESSGDHLLLIVQKTEEKLIVSKKNVPQNDQPYSKIKGALKSMKPLKQRKKIEAIMKAKASKLQNSAPRIPVRGGLNLEGKIFHSNISKKMSLALKKKREKEKLAYFIKTSQLKKRNKEEIKAILQQRKKLHQKRKMEWRKSLSNYDPTNTLKNTLIY